MDCSIPHGRSGPPDETRVCRRVSPSALAAGLLLICATAAHAQTPASDSSRNASEGAYTAVQAKQGETTFGSICGNCHTTTEFRGPTFRRIWTGRSVYELFDQLRNTMPLDNPGGLSREQYANVIAYVLKLNEYPAGDVELPSSDDRLRRVRF
jgi:mono/diheme cytochrome c family protein